MHRAHHVVLEQVGLAAEPGRIERLLGDGVPRKRLLDRRNERVHLALDVRDLRAGCQPRYAAVVEAAGRLCLPLVDALRLVQLGVRCGERE